MNYAKTEMIYSHRSNRKHKHSTKHGVKYRNHWYDVYKCPICGKLESHKKKPYICKGSEK